MKIAVGSMNPAKIRAVEDGLNKVFPDGVVVGVKIESGVSDQPVGDKETFKGARLRAERALKKAKADMGVGLEGGVVESNLGMMNVNWCVMVTKDGVESAGGGSRFLLPERYAGEIRKGKELAEVVDKLEQEKDIRSKQGVIGVLTKNLLKRQEEYAHIVKLAAVKFISPELYNG